MHSLPKCIKTGKKRPEFFSKYKGALYSLPPFKLLFLHIFVYSQFCLLENSSFHVLGQTKSPLPVNKEPKRLQGKVAYLRNTVTKVALANEPYLPIYNNDAQGSASVGQCRFEWVPFDAFDQPTRATHLKKIKPL